MLNIKDFADDKEAFEILNDEKEIEKVLLILQEASDEYMRQIREKIADPRKAVKDQAREIMELAAAVIQAEKKIREHQLYHSLALKNKGIQLITSV